MQDISLIGDLVVLHGDEMAQVAFQEILERFVKKRTAIRLHEIDLSAKNRLRTNGAVVQDAIHALLRYRVGVKNAGITVNKAQLTSFLSELASEGNGLDEKKLAPLATKSPNGAIRKAISGNIFREDIPFTNLKRTVPEWKGRDIVVSTLEHGGLKDSQSGAIKKAGTLTVTWKNDAGKTQTLHSRAVNTGDIYLLATVDIKAVKEWAYDFFERALTENRPAFMALKDTVLPGYDGVIKEAVENIFHEQFAARFKESQLTYQYGLIDAQAASMVTSPPIRALWGIPDNNTGEKMRALVEGLKHSGIASGSYPLAVSRMSAGGGDQYGSFNAPAFADGVITVMLEEEILCMQPVGAGDPLMLMTNMPGAIYDWVSQTFSDAVKKNQAVYFGFAEDHLTYDAVAAQQVEQVVALWKQTHVSVPPYTLLSPADQLLKMVCDPAPNGCYAALNLDGDIFSDIAAALGGSLATASSIIASTEGHMVFEAPHGTAPDLYQAYLKSNGKQAYFNPSALLYAVANALEVIAEKQGQSGTALQAYGASLKRALINTVEAGYITPDIKGHTIGVSEKVLDLFGFLDAVEEQLRTL